MATAIMAIRRPAEQTYSQESARAAGDRCYGGYARPCAQIGVGQGHARHGTDDVFGLLQGKARYGLAATTLLTICMVRQAMETNKQWALVPRIKRIEMFEHAVRQMEDSISKMEAEERKHRHWNSLIVREALQKVPRRCNGACSR